MAEHGVNPLAKHFRQPSIYLKLPSGGKYWKDGSLDLPVNGEIPVYPMTTKDEITLRTPDALLNGQGVVDVIQSCCPNIKDAWQMPNNESDAILIAMRIASYGPTMTINSTCPHCSKDSTYDIDLNIVLDQTRFPNFDKKLFAHGLTFKFKPQNFASANTASLIAFEEQKVLETLIANDMSDDTKVDEFNKRMKKFTELNLELLASSIDYIETDTGEKVADSKFIKEFFDNAQAATVKEVQSAIEDITAESKLPNVKVSCDSCEKNYEIAIEFNYSSFFGNS